MLLRDVIRDKKPVDKVPIWFMRQAGRYLPEYRQLRSEFPDFLSFCASPEAACEATLQPMRRFDLDAAIIFSDILVIPAALGQNVEFIKGVGPKLSPLSHPDEAQNLSLTDIQKRLSATPEAIKLTRCKLTQQKTLIGFSGAPWTVLCYMFEGGGSKNFDLARHRMARYPDLAQTVLEKVVAATILYLKAQIQAGADVIKMFDSWAGLCPAWLQQKMIMDPVRHIITSLKQDFPETPVIYFPRGTHADGVRLAKLVGADCVAIDQFVDPNKLQITNDISYQGGLDPMLMLTGGALLASEVEKYLKIFEGKPYIFNMGHGMVPEMPISNVEKTIELVRKLS